MIFVKETKNPAKTIVSHINSHRVKNPVLMILPLWGIFQNHTSQKNKIIAHPFF
jgi:hypothetical protein